jgi:hypothetical protein
MKDVAEAELIKALVRLRDRWMEMAARRPEHGADAYRLRSCARDLENLAADIAPQIIDQGRRDLIYRWAEEIAEENHAATIDLILAQLELEAGGIRARRDPVEKLQRALRYGGVGGLPKDTIDRLGTALLEISNKVPEPERRLGASQTVVLLHYMATRGCTYPEAEERFAARVGRRQDLERSRRKDLDTRPPVL